ncbi:MAG: domain S-box [Bacillota bacterium]|jgi:iron only hydrogenase large subunit-like protein/uncharacterized Fe-S cluster-containing protein|nr:domain S-box [Bacillota bacterium]
MSTIEFKESNCKNCYKCLRNCPVKAITFFERQAAIVEDECILCGRCLSVCPQDAKKIRNYTDIVKKYIQKKEKVYVSLAPSFVSSFEQSPNWVFAVLKRLGFTGVEETAAGAVQVSRQYERLMVEQKMANIITTACPSVVMLVEKHYPELIPYMAPVVSPMIAHAKMMRETYGKKIKVVFIGPCIAKIEEYKDFRNDGAVDAILTYEELLDWIRSEGIDENTDLSEELKSVEKNMARIYPTPGGIIKTIEKDSRKNYQCITVDGIERCMEILESMKHDGLRSYFIEMNSCTGGCIGGPYRQQLPGGFLEARRKLLNYVKEGMRDDHHAVIEDRNINFSKVFTDRSSKTPIPSEAVIQGILNSTGKFTKADELNCGACGYANCREKAIAVFREKAQLPMCMPYMRDRAESISNLIINSTPNAIIALDNKMDIQELNKAAREMFLLDSRVAEGSSIFEILACEDIARALRKKENFYDKRFYYADYDITVEQSVIWVEKHNIAVIICRNVSMEEEKRRELFEIRRETVEIAQKVIDKQMRVAQEIASLLGETTAETKVTLTRLKKSIMAEMSDES